MHTNIRHPPRSPSMQKCRYCVLCWCHVHARPLTHSTHKQILCSRSAERIDETFRFYFSCFHLFVITALFCDFFHFYFSPLLLLLFITCRDLLCVKCQCVSAKFDGPICYLIFASIENEIVRWRKLCETNMKLSSPLTDSWTLIRQVTNHQRPVRTTTFDQWKHVRIHYLCERIRKIENFIRNATSHTRYSIKWQTIRFHFLYIRKPWLRPSRSKGNMNQCQAKIIDDIINAKLSSPYCISDRCRLPLFIWSIIHSRVQCWSHSFVVSFAFDE